VQGRGRGEGRMVSCRSQIAARVAETADLGLVDDLASLKETYWWDVSERINLRRSETRRDETHNLNLFLEIKGQLDLSKASATEVLVEVDPEVLPYDTSPRRKAIGRAGWRFLREGSSAVVKGQG
jgi:hypothetical protein